MSFHPTQTGLCKFGWVWSSLNYAPQFQNRELRNIYHHHPESKKRKSSEANSGSIHPYGRYENAIKTRKAISTIAIFRGEKSAKRCRERGRKRGGQPVKAIFEKRAATVEVDTLISPVRSISSTAGPFGQGLRSARPPTRLL